MKFTRGFDVVLNVVAPLLTGVALYFTRGAFHTVPFIGNHMADGLWAYAFISSILIIWERELKPSWMIIVFAVAASFEIFQHWHFIEGTADLDDVIAYYIFFMIAIALNKFFKTSLKLAP